MTVLFLVAIVVIVAGIIFKLETSKPKVEEPVKRLEVVTLFEPEIELVPEPELIQETAVETETELISEEEAPKKSIELKPKTVTKTVAKTKSTATKTKKSEK